MTTFEELIQSGSVTPDVYVETLEEYARERKLVPHEPAIQLLYEIDKDFTDDHIIRFWSACEEVSQYFRWQHQDGKAQDYEGFSLAMKLVDLERANTQLPETVLDSVLVLHGGDVPLIFQQVMGVFQSVGFTSVDYLAEYSDPKNGPTHFERIATLVGQADYVVGIVSSIVHSDKRLSFLTTADLARCHQKKMVLVVTPGSVVDFWIHDQPQILVEDATVNTKDVLTLLDRLAAGR